MAKKPDAPEAAARYKKEKILTASKYVERKDILQAVLIDNKMYTLEEVDAAIEKFMKGRIK
jgi:hypothetical protein